MLGKILGLATLCAVIAAVVIFIEPIREFSNSYNLQGASIPELEIARQKNPENVAIALQLANEYHYQSSDKKRNQKQAESLYKAILKKHPQHVGALIGYGRFLSEQPGKDNKALLQYRKALEIDKSNEDLLGALGTFYKTRAENPKLLNPELRRWLYQWSVYYYRLAIYVNPNRFQPRFNMGVAYQQLDDRENSAREYCDAIALLPGSYEARYNLGLILLDLNYLNEAGRQFQKSVALLSETPGGDLDAQELRRRIEGVTNNVYYDAAKSSLGPEELPQYLSPACLLNNTL